MSIRCMVGIHKWSHTFEEWTGKVKMSSGIVVGYRHTFKVCSRCRAAFSCELNKDVPAGVPMILDRQ